MDRDRTLAWVAPLLLAALAALQIALATGAGMSPWKGGGFGMFATLDHPGLREVRLIDANGDVRRAPGHARRLRDTALAWPTQARLEALAVAVEHEMGPVRVEVWRVRIDRGLEPHPERIAAWPGAER